MITAQGDWQVLKSETLFTSRWLSVLGEKVATPTRPLGVDWLVARRSLAAIVAPRLPNGDYILVQQERVAVRLVTWEFPAGQVDEAPTGDALRETAIREMGEEAGYIATEPLIDLGMFYPSVGFTTECGYLFLARNVVAAPHVLAPEGSEAIYGSCALSPAQLQSWIAEGKICDANTLALYARLVAKDLFV